MKKRVGFLFAPALMLGIAAPVQAQFYLPPQCELDTGHFLVNQAQLYVKAAAEASDDVQRDQALQDAMRVLQDAIARGEVGQVGVWYFLGRTYGMLEDYAGADSAYSKVESMMPECGEDTDIHRNMLWVPVYNEAVNSLQVSDWGSAKTQLWQANVIYSREPFVPYYLASIHAQDAEPDSAVKYFKETVELIESAPADSIYPDSTYGETHDQSVFNVARLYHQLEQWDSAVVWYETYLELVPGDRDALFGMAYVYESSDRLEDARAVYRQMIEDPGDIPAGDLFSVGVSLFNSEDYLLAVQAFNAGLQKNPYHRDGIYNLGQSYFAIASPSEPDSAAEPTAEQMSERTLAAVDMLDAAQRLVEVDPQNRDALMMLAQAWQLAGDDDSTIAVFEQMEALQFDIALTEFTPTEDGVEIAGIIENLKEENLTVPAVTFEFIDVQGSVIVTETWDGATLEGHGTTEFRFSPVGEGIVAWRYTIPEPTPSEDA
jgi:tetratricopeptide (TPR) repeat protein